MADIVETIGNTRQVWTVNRHFENIDLDTVELKVYEEGEEVVPIVEVTWNAQDFFKKMVDLQYEYGR